MPEVVRTALLGAALAAVVLLLFFMKSSKTTEVQQPAASAPVDTRLFDMLKETEKAALSAAESGRKAELAAKSAEEAVKAAASNRAPVPPSPPQSPPPAPQSAPAMVSVGARHSRVSSRKISNPIARPTLKSTAKTEGPTADQCEGISQNSTGSWTAKHFGNKFMMCHHGASDAIGNAWINLGTWPDCQVLPALAYAAYEYSTYSTENGEPLVLDVGGNIGSCSMMMRSTGLCPTVFEPVPVNMKMLATSLAINNYDCVEIVNAGLGTEPAKMQIKIQHGNNGNNMIDTENKRGASDAVLDGSFDLVPVEVLRMDDIVHHHVHLMKMDVQGFEVRVLKGMRNVFESYGVDMIFFEYAPGWIARIGDEPMDFPRFLFDYGFTILARDGTVMTDESLTEKTKSFLAAKQIGGESFSDFIALSPSMVSRIKLDKFAEYVKIHGDDPSRWPKTREEWRAATKVLARNISPTQ